ncbi:MAG: murein peptide amidase [Frankiales bacterium]|nr:murein peptide amidase [Frankiales bacterium]
MARVRGAAALIALLVSSCSASPTTSLPVPSSSPSGAHAAVVRSPAPIVFGRSVHGRPLTVWELGPPSAPHRVLVIGVIHGDETAGRAVALDALHLTVPPGTQLLVVPDANPDGEAAGTRQNAHGVDLNRNFPFDWQPLGRRGDQQYSGPKPLSEPESAALATLIDEVRPEVSVWFHQPVGVVDESGGDLAVERRFAADLGEPLRRLTRYPGSAVGWENHTFAGSSAFVVELPHQVGRALEQRAVRAVQHLLVPPPHQ